MMARGGMPGVREVWTAGVGIRPRQKREMRLQLRGQTYGERWLFPGAGRLLVHALCERHRDHDAARVPLVPAYPMSKIGSEADLRGEELKIGWHLSQLRLDAVLLGLRVYGERVNRFEFVRAGLAALPC